MYVIPVYCTVLIHEYPKNTSYRKNFVEQQIPKNKTCVTFYKFNNIYKFIGVYKLNIKESKEINKCVWERISNIYKV